MHFWDGRDYCRLCLDASAPGVFDYAVAHPTLHEFVPDWFNERLPSTAKEALRRFVVTWSWEDVFRWIRRSKTLLVLAGGALLIAWRWLPEAGGTSAALRVVALIDTITIAGIFFKRVILPAWVRAPSPPRSVEVADGTLTLQHGGTVLHQAPLSEWRWWEGKEMGNSLRRLQLPTDELLVLVTENYQYQFGAAMAGQTSFGQEFAMVFCGFTPEMRERWLALFRLAGVAKAYGLDS